MYRILIVMPILATLVGCREAGPDQWGRLIVVVPAAPAAEVGTRAVPATAVEFTLRVSGPGMQTITATFPRQQGPTELAVDVPAGRQRRVLVDAFDASGFRVGVGGVELDIEAGATVQAQIEMRATGGIVVIIQ